MKTNIEVLFVVILIIINVVVSGFFVFLLITIDSPDIYAEIKIKELTSEELTLETLIDITNPNSFELTFKNVKIASETKEGEKFTSFLFKGGKVPSNDRKSFKSIESIVLKGKLPKVLVNTITADVGVKFFGFIEKIIPIKAVAVISFEDFINNISVPKIKIHGGIRQITEDGLIFAADIEISNPSDIELIIDDMFADLKTENDVSVGSINFYGGILEPKGTLNLFVSGLLTYEALNSKSIIVDVEGKATVNVAGLTQTITISASAAVDVPNLSDLLKFENNSFDFSLVGSFKLRLRGVVTTVTFTVYNPSEIPLEARNMKCTVYGVTGGNKKKIAEKEMEVCTVSSKNEICASTQITLSYLKLLLSGSGRLLPEHFSIRLEGYFAIDGTTQVIPISVNGYLDPHLFI
jgi:LEA14-like dessication related protein